VKYELTAAMEDQLVAIAAYIRRDNRDAARRFLAAAYKEFEFVANWPEASPLARLRKPSFRGVRYRPVRRPFQNYLIFYRVEKDRVLIGSVLWGGMNWTDDLSVF
jgi:plasmid stabilization system protein ParE